MMPLRQKFAWFFTPQGVKTNYPLDEQVKRDKMCHVITETLKQVKQTEMKSLLFATAVLAQISRFHALKVDFSAYDVTSALREKLSAGELDITDVEKKNIGGNLVSFVEHEKVRAIVSQLFELDLIPDYQSEVFFNPNRGLSYMLYKHANSVGAATPVAVPTVAVPAPTATAPATNFVSGLLPVGNVNLAPAAPVGTNLKVADADMWTKVVVYVANQRTLAQTPTLKQVQSRLKGYAVSCAELEKFFLQRGYRLLRPSNNLSQAQVL